MRIKNKNKKIKRRSKIQNLYQYEQIDIQKNTNKNPKKFHPKKNHGLKPKQNQLEQENKILIIDKLDLFRVELNHFGIQSKRTKVPKYSKTHTKASD